MLNRPTFASFWVTILAAASLSPPAAAAERPNFLVILCDDLGYGDIGCFGHPVIKTPHLDALAKAGMRLTDCYSAAPVCSSSRAGLMTGRTPSRSGVYDWIPANHPMHLTREEITIATLLKNAGYATCHVGKWHLNGRFNQPNQPQPGDHGFDHWMSTQNNAGPSHENPNNFVRNGERIGVQQGYSCQIVAEEAIGWLKDKRDQAKPFFQFVCFHEPHEPIASPPELVDEYQPLAKTPIDDTRGKPGTSANTDSDPERDNLGRAMYYANVANIDRAVGRVLAALDELKLAENTLVLFTSDNGPETLNRYPTGWRSHGSPGPLRGMKLHCYDGGIRVPGILRWPAKVPPGETIREPICSLDLLPTFCELAGIDPPADRALDGTSIAPLLQGEKLVRTTPLFWHYYRSLTGPKAALRDGDWMVLGAWEDTALPQGVVVRGDVELIKSRKLARFELYNLASDVGEQTDLADKEPQRLQELSAKLIAKYEEVQAAAPVWSDLPEPGAAAGKAKGKKNKKAK
ncbi:MAG TPA: sulfatase [Pirellulaceae bacterium]|nr:sulfatase [Pirellulaceae bacterium]